MDTASLNIVLAGHVDHGKSTIVGRLLADTGSLPDGKLDQVKEYCRRNARPFEYAFLIDALKNEQAQGVTIDSARVFFRTGGRKYIIIDAPGHIEFIRNMVTGASRADGALLVVDASEGIQDNSRRHCALLALLGIRQLVVLVNKMDLVSYRQDDFEKIKMQFAAFLDHWSLAPMEFIAVSGLLGENIATRSAAMPWYTGPTVLECIATLQTAAPPISQQFRMWVQDVYKFTNNGDARRIVAGTIESGSLHTGDHVIFLPSGKKTSVKAIEEFNAPDRPSATVGEAVGFTLTEQIFVPRGELAVKTEEAHPHLSSRFRASIFWLGREPMVTANAYLLKIGTAKLSCRLEAIHNVQDGASLELKQAECIGRHEIADCDIRVNKPIAFDLASENPTTGRFVIVDHYEIRGGGIIREALEDNQSHVREKVLVRDYKWESSNIPAEERGARFGQKPALIIITGVKDSGKKPLAKAIEKKLLDDGRFAYFIGIGNVLYGVDADIKGLRDDRREHIRRLAEVAHILLDAGMIVIMTAIELTQDELELMLTAIRIDNRTVVWVGSETTTDIPIDIRIDDDEKTDAMIEKLISTLKLSHH